MEGSVWTGTLAQFRERVGGTEPVPAGISISAVTASLALALLAKVLDITGSKKNFSGNRQLLETLIEAARSESLSLTQLADEDILAFNQYLQSMREGNDQAIAAAARQTVEVPMNTARVVVRGLDLCAQAVDMVHGLTAADLGIAAALLSGAFQSTMISVDANVREMQLDEEFRAAMTEERRALEAYRARACSLK